jgi:hypothetical protein
VRIGKPYRVETGMACWVVKAPWDDQVVVFSGNEAKQDAEYTADILNTAYERGYIDGKDS